MEIEYKWIPEESLVGRITECTVPVSVEQGYLCHEPVIRIRHHGEKFYMTYKGEGTLEREEYNLPLNRQAFEALLPKCEGRIIRKDRYTVLLSDLYPELAKDVKGPNGAPEMELDVFRGELEGLCYLEIEFASKEDAMNFKAPEEFGRNVTFDPSSSNSALSRK